MGPYRREERSSAKELIASDTSAAILGPSGSGKSTLLYVLGILATPTSGRVLIDGRNVTVLDDITRSSLRNKHIGFVFQSYNLLSGLTALDNVALPMKYAGIGPWLSRLRQIDAGVAADYGRDSHTQGRP